MAMKTMMAAAALVLAIGCGSGSGGSTTGSASFTGTVRGQSFSPKETLSTDATIPTSQGAANVGAVILTDQANTCSHAGANSEAKGSKYFVIALGELLINGSDLSIIKPKGPGNFGVYSLASGGFPPSKLAIVVSETTGNDCKDTAALEAVGTGGTVRVTSISNGSYAGDFDITLTEGDGNGDPKSGGSTDHVTGTFSAAGCASLGALVSTTRSTTCL